MLAGMSSTEYADWHRFYSTHYFHDVLLDMHFSGLTYTVLSLFFSDPDNWTPTTSISDLLVVVMKKSTAGISIS
ncbi:TPA: hypothetical protein IFB36_003828 [Escherichia coli]|nr:hypothetical protein [Escherichia coli]EFH5644072.1 hypothetical protein [Escherichia coli]HAN4138605.1 hypothetical protein [Escherichia coli]